LEEGKRTGRLRKRQVNGQTGSQEEGMQSDRQASRLRGGYAVRDGKCGWVLYRREGLGRVDVEHVGRDGKFT
jgi:hypothetical protein